MLEADLDSRHPNTGTVQGVKIEKACLSSDNTVGKATTLENSVDSPKSSVLNDERVPTPTTEAPPTQTDVLCTIPPAAQVVVSETHDLEPAPSQQQGAKRKPQIPAASPAKKKKVVFPKIRPEDKCNKCHHCLNPKLRKACIPARHNQIAEKVKQDRLLKQAGPIKRTSAAAAVSTAPSQPQIAALSVEPSWASQLTDKLTHQGGMQDKHVKFFEQVMQSEQDIVGRTMILDIILLTTSIPALKQLVASGRLKTLQRWLADACEAGTDNRITKLLQCLAHLPVDFESLKNNSNSIAMSVAKLRKHSSENVKNEAQRLVDKWKQLVLSSSSESHGKPTRPDGKKDEPPAKRVKRDDVQAGKPAAPDSTAKPAAPSLPAGHIKVLDDDDDFPKHADAPAKKASAAPTQRKVHKLQLVSTDYRPPNPPAVPSSATPPPAASDAEEDKHAAAPGAASAGSEAQPSNDEDAAGPGEAAGASGAPDHAQGSSKAAADGKPAGTAGGGSSSGNGSGATPPAPAPAATPAAPAPAPAGSGAPVSSTGTDGAFASSSAAAGVAGGGAKPGGRPGMKGSNVTSLSAGSSQRLGSLTSFGAVPSSVTRITSGVGTSSYLSSIRGPQPSAAAQRAAEAAARHPSPERVERRDKLKKVSWAPDSGLLHVRWFKKDSPAAAVQEGPQGAEEEVVGPQEPPAGFQQAARKEHAAERELLQKHVLEEEELKKRLDSMRPTMAVWHTPRHFHPDKEKEWQVAAGEDSEEKNCQVLRERGMKGRPPHNYQLPLTPQECAPEPDYPPSSTFLIPLSIPQGAAPQPLPQPQPQPLPLQQPPNAPVQYLLPGSHLAQHPSYPPPSMHVANGGQPSNPYTAAQAPSFGPPGPSTYPPDLTPAGLPAAHAILHAMSSGPPFPHDPLAHMRPPAPPAVAAAQRAPRPSKFTAKPPELLPGGRDTRVTCLFFNSAKGCRNGDRCKFKHVQQDMPAAAGNPPAASFTARGAPAARAARPGRSESDSDDGRPERPHKRAERERHRDRDRDHTRGAYSSRRN